MHASSIRGRITRITAAPGATAIAVAVLVGQLTPSEVLVVGAVTAVVVVAVSVRGTRAFVGGLHRLATHASRAAAALQPTDATLTENAPRWRPTGMDEVDRAAAAVEELHASASGLAAAQVVQRRLAADSLLNLGRRVQGLVTLQLERIAELELSHPTGDLDTLHRIDHLGTRIRRNAESLIVLASNDNGPRRSSSAGPITVVDVVAAAVAEVEQFERASLGALQPAKIAGQVSPDVAHLLAELTENALAFSPPTTTVEIVGLASNTGEYRIYVADSGIGMTADALARANHTLTGTTDITTSGSRFLGLHVTGRLARRHNIEVTLATNGAGGITATITVPTCLVTAVRAFDADAQLSPARTHSHYGAIAASRRSFDDQVRNVA